MTCLRLVLGDQLNPEHPWFASVRPDVVYVLMEIRQETDYVLHHAQKILAIFAAMRRFADQLRAAGHRVSYLAIDAPDNSQSLTANLDALLARHAAGTRPARWSTSPQTSGGWISSCASTPRSSRYRYTVWTVRIF